MLKFSRINRNIRSIRRYRTILSVLIKYGFGHIVEQLNINYYLELGRKIVTFNRAPREIDRLSQPERLRLAMAELGPTFIKLGQLLSTRPDLIPKEYAEEFGKLQDQAPFVPLPLIRKQIEEDFSCRVEEFFLDFSPTPLAAASIAQVHRARLLSGEDVVVKVRRPGIRDLLETDLDILMGLAYLIERHLPTNEVYEPTTIVKEARRTLLREIDFTREGHTINRFAANFAGDHAIVIPKVFWEQTSERVLTLEFIDGIKVSELEQLSQAGYDCRTIARNGAEAFLRQVLCPAPQYDLHA